MANRKTPYYSIRTGKYPAPKGLSLQEFKKVFNSLFDSLEREGYFQESFGYQCVDAGYVPGKLGSDVAIEVLLELRKQDLLPVQEKLNAYSEEDLFDVIEFYFEYCSKPIEGNYHSWADCGWHYSTFDGESGRIEVRERLNRILARYGSGYELSSRGEIFDLPQAGFEALLSAQIPTEDPTNVLTRIESAVRKFRRYNSSLDERRDAIRDLADVFEFLRPQVRQVLATEDENDLFNLANNFEIRHHNVKQKGKYDRAIWYSWMFYFYLASIHAALRLIDKVKDAPQSPGSVAS